MTESREHPLNLSSTVETDLLPRQDLASACQPLCAPGNCGGSTCSLSRKRSLFTVVRSQNETGFGNETFDIHARTLSDSDEEGPVQITKYLKEKNLDNPTILGLCADGGAYESYCTQKAFASFPTDSQSYVGTGPTELTGCTVLTVVSARAVYMCHLWETLGFVQSFDANAPPPDFYGNVFNLISGLSPLYHAFGDTLDPALYNGAHDLPYAFISTPRAYGEHGDVRTPLYGNEINNLRELLELLIPSVIVIVRPYEKPWVPDATNGLEYPADEEWRGQALFEYDPDADGQHNADWRLWYEQAAERGRRGLGQPVE